MKTEYCKNCKYWMPCGRFDTASRFKICTNEKVFIKKPDGMRGSEMIHRSNFSGVYTNDIVYQVYMPKEDREKEPIVTGENFGCIHFESL